MHLSRTSGWLGGDTGESVVAIASGRHIPLDPDGLLGVTWHWTASRGRTRAHVGELAKSIVDGSGPSWHLAIGRAGNVVQSVGLHRGANHVGKFGLVAGRQRSVNRSTVGVELENLGRVIRVGPEWRQVVNPAEPPHTHAPSAFACPDAEVVECDGAHWHAYSDAQVATAEALICALVARFGWTREAFGYSHSAFDPARKADPGVVWTKVHLPAILDRVFP